MKTKLKIGAIGWFYINPNDITQRDGESAKCVFNKEIESIELKTTIDSDGERITGERYTVSLGWDKATIDAKDIFITEQEAIERAKEDISEILNRRENVDSIYKSALNNIAVSCNDEDTPEFYSEAVNLVRMKNKVSIPAIVRHFSVGYLHAERIIRLMEEREVISKAGHKGERDILPFK